MKLIEGNSASQSPNPTASHWCMSADSNSSKKFGPAYRQYRAAGGSRSSDALRRTLQSMPQSAGSEYTLADLLAAEKLLPPPQASELNPWRTKADLEALRQPIGSWPASYPFWQIRLWRLRVQFSWCREGLRSRPPGRLAALGQSIREIFRAKLPTDLPADKTNPTKFSSADAKTNAKGNQ